MVWVQIQLLPFPNGRKVCHGIFVMMTLKIHLTDDSLCFRYLLAQVTILCLLTFEDALVNGYRLFDFALFRFDVTKIRERDMYNIMILSKSNRL